jgi:hypothetical protein
MPCDGFVAEVVKREYLRTDIGRFVGTSFDKEDGVACARKIGCKCTYGRDVESAWVALSLCADDMLTATRS